MIEAKIKELVAKLTLEEKASLCSGLDFWQTKPIQRLGVPSIMVSDGPHGLRKQEGHGDHLGIYDSIKSVCYPAACATACSFNSKMLNELGMLLGTECTANGVSILLGPAINIKRSPLCGRNFEYFSEDPCLTGELAAAFINGVQSMGVGACVKHFAANNQECRRMTVSADIDNRTLHEIYLAGFKRAITKAKPLTVMSAYNRINGVYSSENKMLLTDILRNAWGFNGLVVSDWYAVSDRVASLNAGLDLEMPGCNGETDAQIVEAVKNGSLKIALLDKAVQNILTVVLNVTTAKKQQLDNTVHHKKAVEMAEESAVLLKNDNNILPFNINESVAFIGGFAENPRYQGGGSSHINAYKVISALQAAKDCNVSYVQGFGVADESFAQQNLDDAIKCAAKCGKAVIFAGLPESFESEGYDRKHMQLPEVQNQFIFSIAKICPTIVVLHNGSPVEMPWINSVSAVVEMHLGGEGVGEACKHLLYGEVCPSGRLAETFPVALADNPSYLFYPGNTDRSQYREGVFVGYRYYTSKNIKTLFPFGYGLSYSSFSYSNLTVSSDEISDKQDLKVSVTVTNTGNYNAKEVVQLYVSDKSNQIERPCVELKAFEKISLKIGQCKTVSFTLSACDFSYYNDKINKWIFPTGSAEIIIASNAKQKILSKQISLVNTTDLPFIIDQNTSLEQLFAHPKTKNIVSELFKGVLAFNTSPTSMNSEMLSAAYMQAPLRTIRKLIKYDTQQLADLIATLNQSSND